MIYINYNIFRWYRAGWGRYTQRDPVGLIGGLNLFAYARQNPLTYVDPTGRAAARTCCMSGQVSICVEQNLIEPAMQCVLEHEQEHVDFIRRWAPCNPCRYRPDRASVGGDTDLQEWGVPPEGPTVTECAGYRREYDCLRRNRNRAPNPGMIDRRLDQIIEFLDRNYPSCFAGQSWR